MNVLSLAIDLILVLIFASCIFDGRKKGFIKMVLSILATIVSVIIAYEYSAPFAQWANEVFVQNAATGAIADMISSHLSNGTQAIIDAIPAYIIEAAEAGGIAVSSVVSNIGSAVDAQQAAEQIYGGIYSVIISPALKVIAFLIIYAIANFVLSFGISIINKFFKLPILKGLNKLLGGALGAVKGIIVVGIVGVVLVAAGGFFPETLGPAVNEANIPQLAAEIFLSK